MRPHPPREYPLTVTKVGDHPLHADAVWQPEGWRTGAVSTGDVVANGVRLFHDDPEGQVALEDDPTLRIEQLRGTFLSLACDLPPNAIDGLADWHIFSVRMTSETQPTFARLNLTVGPDTLTWTVGWTGDTAAFDLDRNLPAAPPVTHGWIDLIFPPDGPQRRRITDLRFARYPRAAM